MLECLFVRDSVIDRYALVQTDVCRRIPRPNHRDTHHTPAIKHLELKYTPRGITVY